MSLKDYNISGKPFAQGGAAAAYECFRIADGTKCVKKELICKEDSNKVERFKREIEVMQKCLANNIQGIMPIYECNSKELWYIMPKAECLADIIRNLKSKNSIDKDELLKKFVEYFIELAETFSKIHELGYVHRDIKPHNLYHYQGGILIGDFGIVDIPEKEGQHITKKGDRLGAWNTIAPEVLRDANNSTDKADVYSLAKTFWMCLTFNLEGFDGRYDYSTTSMSLHDIPHLSGSYLLDIDELLSDCTQEDPNLRPNMSDFATRLKTWKETKGNFSKRCKKEWSFIFKSIFNGMHTPFMTITESKDIARALDILGRYTITNYSFLPSHGGLELRGANIAPEPGCIYLYCGFCLVCKPKQLTFRGFSNDESWNYFYLELEGLEYVIKNEIDEELIEDKPGHYTDATYAAHGVYDYESGKPLPEGWKKVCRYNRGAFLIVAKTSFYNSITPVQDARHADVSENDFHEYMNKIKKDVDNANGDRDKLQGIRKKYWNNPFISPKIESIPQQEQIDDNYVSNNLETFNFSKMLNNNGDDYAAYAVAFKKEIAKHNIIDALFNPKDYYLCDDGKIRLLEYNNPHIFYVHSKEIAIKLKKDIESIFEDFCEKNGIIKSPLDANIEIQVRMTNVPDHIFSYRELKDAIIHADDRVQNTVCIDDKGYVTVVSPELSQFYPVSYETIPSLNNYVGPYSNGKMAAEIIMNMEVLWLQYLETGFESRYSGDDERNLEDINTAIKGLIDEYKNGTKQAPILHL